jgi:hypothetical protein
VGGAASVAAEDGRKAQTLTTMFSFLVTSCFTLVAAQLELAQHTALMDVYNALGSNGNDKETKIANEKKKKNVFLFRLFHCIVPALRGDCTVPYQ